MNRLKPFILLLCLIFVAGRLQAQSPVLPPDDSTRYKLLLDSVTQKYKSDVAAIKGTNSKYIIGLYKERYENIKDVFEAGGIITEPEVYKYLEALLKVIYQSNPSLRSITSRVLFSRAYWPNASSMGEGTILFNIGLFCKLQNESQAAFVVCHELAHLYLNQSNKAIEQYVNTIYSDEFQKALRNIQRSAYQKGQHLESLAKNLTFKSRRHSREHESEADSMAIEWMKNTTFDLKEALSCLSLLDSVDKDKYDVGLNLPRYFNFASYPFQQRWLLEDAGLAVMATASKNENKKETDSLKTHPDCQARVASLQETVKRYQKGERQKFVVNEQEFMKLKSQFDIEIVSYCYKTGLISRCLYLSLEMLPFYKDDTLVYSLIADCLNQCYLYQKQHELTKVTDLPAPYFEKKYDSLLHFIQNLRLPEWAALSYYFALQYEARFKTNEEFLNSLITSKEIFNRQDERRDWIDFYNKNFPHGKYTFKKIDN